MMRLFLVFVLMIASGMMAEVRTFTDQKGRSLEAEFLGFEGEGDKIKVMAKRQVYFLKVEDLSDKDQQWVKELQMKALKESRSSERDAQYSELQFEDDFSEDGFSERWKHYAGESVVEEGVLKGRTIDIKVHAGVDSVHVEPRRDWKASLKFRFASEEATRFNIWFNDQAYKEAHAGHILAITVSSKKVKIADGKYGRFEMERYQRVKGGTTTEEDKKIMEDKEKTFPIELEGKKEDWQHLAVYTQENVAVVLLNGEEVGRMEAEGIGHETKSHFSLTTYVNDVYYDDVRLESAPVE